jgi:hypothetical protein
MFYLLAESERVSTPIYKYGWESVFFQNYLTDLLIVLNWDDFTAYGRLWFGIPKRRVREGQKLESVLLRFGHPASPPLPFGGHPLPRRSLSTKPRKSEQ